MKQQPKPKGLTKNIPTSGLNALKTSLKIIAIYVIIGFVWIIGSDRTAQFLFPLHHQHLLFQTAKGILFVIVTGYIFFLIIYKQLKLYIVTISDLKIAYENLDLGHKKSLTLENQLYDLAFYDTLTGLPNRTMLEKTINDYFNDHKDNAMIGLVYFDIDEFRNINEVKGHSVGDQLIKMIGLSLSQRIEKPHMLARMGGDEFVIALFDFNDIEMFLPTIESYMDSIRSTYILEQDNFFVTFSTGVALAPDHGIDYITLMRHADVAMSIAKSKGKDQIVIFDEEMVLLIKQQTELLNQLRQSISNKELSLHYQPIIEVESGKPIGVEALIRWIHPVKGFIPPLEFIELSEKNGFIKDITEFVMAEAAREFIQWEHKKDFMVSINLSASMLKSDKFIIHLMSWIDEYNIDCKKFNIEITETAIIEDIDKSTQVLNALHRLGFTIALDDFGTGYSSLTYLQKLPIDTIKIDRTFIANIKEDTEEFFVLKYMIDLAHHLKLNVVAEGIETKEQHEMIKKYHVDYAQGYYYCKPMAQNRVIESMKELKIKLKK